MPTFTLNNKTASFTEGQTILEAALAQGVEIPHFCYHPNLKIDGCCRMCLVEVERMPKLVISCNTPLIQGMVVNTESEKVKHARAAVLEFILANHPLDCAICDEAGECRLQDYAYRYGRSHSRFSETKRVGKKRVSIGPHLVFDEERCIMCRRCIRFCNDVTKTGELGVFGRGDKTHIDVYPGTEVNNGYSLNLADICPVGALTSSDFRFQVRVWYLTETESICTGCARNCSIRLCHRNNKIYRILPKENPEINQSWICDDGRLLYKRAESSDRLTHPMTRIMGNRYRVSWDEAVAYLREQTNNIKGNLFAGLISPSVTCESLDAFLKLLNSAFHTDNVDSINAFWEADRLLRHHEKAANAEGFRKMGLIPKANYTDSNVIKKISNGEIKGLYVVGSDFLENTSKTETEQLIDSLKQLSCLIVQDTHESELTEIADIVLPSAFYTETSGTVISCDGFTQTLNAAVSPPQMARPDTEIFFSILSNE